MKTRLSATDIVSATGTVSETVIGPRHQSGITCHSHVPPNRHGGTVQELLLVVLLLVCVLVGLQYWSEWNPPTLPAVTSTVRLPGEDLAPLCALSVSPDQVIMATSGLDRMLRFYDLNSRTCQSEIPNQHGEAHHVAYSPDGQYLLVATSNGHIEQWNLQTMPPRLRTIQAHDGEVTCCHFSPDGQSFLTCGDDHRCHLWATTTMQHQREIASLPSTIRCAQFSQDGRQLVLGDIDGQVHCWNVVRHCHEQILRGPAAASPFRASVVGLEMLNQDTELLVATRSGGMTIWDLQTGSPTRYFRTEGRELTSLSLAADQQHVLTGSATGEVAVWNLDSADCLQAFQPHVGPVLSLRSVDTRNLIVSSGWDGELKFTEWSGRYESPNLIATADH